MKALLFILLFIFTLVESYLVYGFYRLQLGMIESLLFSISGLIVLVTTLFLGYYKNALRWSSKSLFTLLCLIGMYFNVLIIKNSSQYQPIPLKEVPHKLSWNEYHSRGHSWIAYKQYVEHDYREVVATIKKQNREIEKQNKIIFERFNRESRINFTEIIFFLGRGLFSILVIFVIDLIVELIQKRFEIDKIKNKSTKNKSKPKSQSITNHNLSSIEIEKRILELSKERYSNGVRKFQNEKIAKILNCDISLVERLAKKRKYEKKETKSNLLYIAK
jgi:hypothetical protein